MAPTEDPWCSNAVQIGNGHESGNGEDGLEFGDNFTSGSASGAPDTNNADFKRLDDSAHYLSALEKRLARVMGTRQENEKKVKKSLLQGLGELRRDRMTTFLEDKPGLPDPSESAVNLEDSALDSTDPVYSSWIMQRFHPERQALSVEELAELLKYDSLQKPDAAELSTENFEVEQSGVPKTDPDVSASGK